jgi:RNA polymerase sigma factor (sigma-70 family)
LSAEAADARIVSKERLDVVLRALARLSTADREIIVLVAWEHLSYEDVAHAMKIELGTVRSRLSRARARLRELVAESGELSDGVR